AGVRAAEDAIRSDVLPPLVDRERTHFVAADRHRREEPLHPVGVALQCLDAGQRAGLSGEGRRRMAVLLAHFPALAGLTRIEELLRRLPDRRHRPLLSNELIA